MLHRNAGLVSLVGASSLALGFTLGVMANETAIKNGVIDGTDAVTVTTSTTDDGTDNVDIESYVMVDGDGDGSGASVSRIDDGKTIRIVIGDQGDGLEPVAERQDTSSDGLEPVAKRQELPSDGSPYDHGMVAKREPYSDDEVKSDSPTGKKTTEKTDKKTEQTEQTDKKTEKTEMTDEKTEKTDKEAEKAEKKVDVTDKQRKSVKELLTKRFGDSAVLDRIEVSSWQGGDGYRLVVSAYGGGDAFSDGKELSKAFGKLARDLAKLAASDFDEIDIMDVTVLGVDDLDGKVPKATPAYKDLEWAGGASVDVPSKDGKSVGDVNRAYVMLDGKPVSVDMTEYGFSSLPEEE